MKRLTEEEIQKIRTVYQEVGTIHKTAALLKHSVPVVNKYVADLSCKKRWSKYCNKTLLQIDPKTLKILKKYPGGPKQAAKAHMIYASGISAAACGYKETAAGFIWCYESEYEEKKKTLKPVEVKYSNVGLVNKLLGLR